jgi:perosamine synthetase
MRVPLSTIQLGGREQALALQAVTDGWISGTGSNIGHFEEALTARVGRAHVVAVNSGTSALELALTGLGVGPGDEVIVPALTFVSPAAAVRTRGARPVLCDIEPSTWTIDVDAASRLVSGRTRAIIAVDLLGHVSNYPALEAIGVPVIEDAAQAHGARRWGRPAGSFGTMSVFSFHANKAVTTGEGGCVATDDPALASHLRVIANHGMTPLRPYFHEVVGRNLRMTNVCAAIGVGQVERWDELVSARIDVELRYRALLEPVGARFRTPDAESEPSCWLATISVDNRDQLVATLRDGGVDSRSIWPDLPSLPLYAPFSPRPCPVAAEVSRTTAWLPTWCGMPVEQIDEVASMVSEWLEPVRRPA